MTLLAEVGGGGGGDDEPTASANDITLLSVARVRAGVNKPPAAADCVAVAQE